jgi:hypothetical protein
VHSPPINQLPRELECWLLHFVTSSYFHSPFLDYNVAPQCAIVVALPSHRQMGQHRNVPVGITLAALLSLDTPFVYPSSTRLQARHMDFYCEPPPVLTVSSRVSDLKVNLALEMLEISITVQCKVFRTGVCHQRTGIHISPPNLALKIFYNDKIAFRNGSSLKSVSRSNDNKFTPNVSFTMQQN